MSNAPNRINKGDILPGIPTDGWNAFVHTWQRVQAMRKPGNGPGAAASVPHVIAEIQNTTGDLIDAEFPILAMGEPVFTFADNAEAIRDAPRFKGTTPDADTQIGDVAIVQGPIGDDEFRVAIIQGPAHCEIDVTDESHTHAKPKADDNTKLESATSGAKIRWKESGTGTKKAVIVLGGGAGGGPGVDIKIVLIDDDIDGITEDGPSSILETSDIELSPEEIAAGVTVVFQEPPDDDLDSNHVDSLNLWGYERKTVELKYFQAPGVDDPGYDPDLTKLILATTVTDDPGEEEEGDERKIVRYATTSVKYDDGKPFNVGQYTRADYPDFPENDIFPPAGLPEGFLKRKYRGIAINGVLITALCKMLPPPELPEE
jgi:hypothetical protein